jgi:hypothetical protein
MFENKIRAMSIDVWKSGGFYFSEDENCWITFTTLSEYEGFIKELVDLYKPSCIITAYPTRFMNVIRFHSRLIAIIELVCEKRWVDFLEMNDSKMKKEVFWKWAVSKQEIMDRYWIQNEHQADSAMFCEYINKIQLWQ